MNFRAFADRHLERDACKQTATEWWNEATHPATGCQYLARNVSSDSLFEHHVPSAIRHVRRFVKSLLSFAGRHSPKKSAILSINESGALVCAGPPAAVDGDLLRIIPISNLIQYAKNASGRTNYTIEEKRQMGEDLLDRDWFRQEITQPLRGLLPNVFWALKEDVERFGLSRMATEIRAFLGLGPHKLSDPHLIVVLEGNKDARFVPTGWDAFDSPYFVPASIGATSGRTKNLWEIGAAGAREVVTLPLSPDKVSPVGLVE